MILVQCCGCGRSVIAADEQSEETMQTDVSSYNSDGKFSVFYNSSATLNPMTTDDADNQMVDGLLYECLLNVDSSFEIHKSVLSTWESEDGIVWVFTIDKGHYFSDGNEVNADDVAYSINSAADNERYAKVLSKWISDVKTDEEGTVTVTLSKANTQFPMLLEIPVIEYNTLSNNVPIGSGPYVYTYSSTVLTPNKYYPTANDLPVDNIYLVTYSSTEDYTTKFNDSTCDIAQNDPSKMNGIGIGSSTQARGYNTTNVHYIIFNMSNAVLSDRKLPHAFSRAFDRDYMVNNLMQGNALATAVPINPASSLYDKQVESQLEYDLDACRKELADIGVDDYDKDGLAEYKTEDGTELDIDLDFVVCSDSQAKIEMAEKFASEMAGIGITVNVKTLNWDNYQEALINGSFDIAYCETKLPSDFDLTSILVSGASLNYNRSYDTEINSLINEYLASDDSDRQTNLDKMLQYIADNALMITICFEKHQLVAHRGMISNITVGQNDLLFDFSNWDINI